MGVRVAGVRKSYRRRGEVLLAGRLPFTEAALGVGPAVAAAVVPWAREVRTA